MPHDNFLAEALAARRFFWSLEFIPSVDRVLRDELAKLGGIAEVMREHPLLATFAVTDRVVSERDPEPIAAAANLLDTTGKQPIVHFSGKGRELSDLKLTVERMTENGLSNLLLLTGDRLKAEPAEGRARYLESVPAVQAVRRWRPDWLLAVAFNPFKYCEEDAMAQYLKLSKKLAAGANLVITQIGLDPLKYVETQRWLDSRYRGVPVVANVLPLSAPRARYMRAHKLAGITITDSMMALLEAEAQHLPDKGAARVLRRLALQIVGVRLAGYAGVQVTGLHTPEKLIELEDAVARAAADCPDHSTWQLAWSESITAPDGTRADPAPAGSGWYLPDVRLEGRSMATRISKLSGARASAGRRLHYRLMRGVHATLFGDGRLARAFGGLLGATVPAGSLRARLLERFEYAVKHPLVGCETCGMCRLAATQYVCPETCPKGLSNGPCGGTTQNRCEFGDRECIHSVKYRIAKTEGVVDELEELLIPAVPLERRHTSSWPAHYQGRGPHIEIVPIERIGVARKRRAGSLPAATSQPLSH